ncbi:MAG: hypothetical protein AAF514_16595 [Verrucomicrobiota bacterium]
MKPTIIACLTLLCLLPGLAPAQNAKAGALSLEGTWDTTMVMNGNERAGVLTVTGSGKEIKGVATSEDRETELEITDIKVDGQKMVLKTAFDYQEQ